MKNAKIGTIWYLGVAYKDLVADLARKLAAPIPSLSADLQALQKDLELLRQAFSEAAIRNLLSDILRKVRKMKSYNLTQAAPTWQFAAPKSTGPSTGGGWKSATPSQAKVSTMKDNAAAKADERVSTVKALNADLQSRIEAELLDHSPTKARYKKVICFGYKVKCAGDSYSGNIDGDPADMQDRCADMIKAIQSAYTLADTMGNYNSNDRILKVFMAPEFYFRGVKGAYTHDIVHGREAQTRDGGLPPLPKIRGIMEVLSDEVDKDCYKNWLFVLGTAIAATELSETVCKVCQGPVTFAIDKSTGKSTGQCKQNSAHQGTIEKSSGAMVENVALVTKEKWRHTVSKALVSGIDYVENKALNKKDHVVVGVKRLPVSKTPQTSGYDSASTLPAKFQDERMNGCIFTVDGITVGLEVCLDHAARGDSPSAGRLEHAANIQLQLIPSAGMKIGSLRTIPGGVVFNVDGLTPHVQVVAGETPEATFDIGPEEWKFKANTWGDLATVGTNMDKRFGATLLDLGNTGKGSWTKITTTTHIASASTGSVVGYGPFKIPKV
jgi:hypothetical protein